MLPQYRAPGLLLPFILSTASRSPPWYADSNTAERTGRRAILQIIASVADAAASAALLYASQSSSSSTSLAGIIICTIGAAFGTAVAFRISSDATLSLPALLGKTNVNAQHVALAGTALIIIVGASMLAAAQSTALGFVSLLSPACIAIASSVVVEPDAGTTTKLERRPVMNLQTPALRPQLNPRRRISRHSPKQGLRPTML